MNVKSALATLALVPVLACAQTAYPTKPVRIIVAFPPGGTTDIVARTISDGLSQRLGQPVVIENKPGGAGGAVGTLEIVRAPPEGYTLGIATVGTLGTAPAVNPRVGYDPLKDFSYVSNIVGNPMIIAAGPKTTARGLDDFIKQVKQQPDSVSFASSGTGGVAHLMAELFKITTGTKMLHIPYRGVGYAWTDMAAGQVEIVFDSLVSANPHLQNGRVRLLAVSGNQRVSAYPDVPTFAELGLSEVDTQVWYGLIGPAGIPKPILDRLSQDVQAILATPDMQARLQSQGATPIGNTPDEFRKQATSEFAKWKGIAESQNIKID